MSAKTPKPEITAPVTPDTVTPASWAQNIRAMAAAGTLRQRVWNDDGDDGRHIACLLGAARGDIKGVGDVPCAALCMPQWLAALIPNLFDGIRDSTAMDYAGRFADVVDGWCVLSPEAWDRIDRRFRAACIDLALEKAAAVQPEPKPGYWDAVQEACGEMAALLKADKPPDPAAFGAAAAKAAKAAAWAAAARAAAARAAEAKAAAWAAWAAWAAEARAAEAAAWAAAAWAAEAAAWAWESMFDTLLCLIAGEIAAAGQVAGGVA